MRSCKDSLSIWLSSVKVERTSSVAFLRMLGSDRRYYVVVVRKVDMFKLPACIMEFA